MTNPTHTPRFPTRQLRSSLLLALVGLVPIPAQGGQAKDDKELQPHVFVNQPEFGHSGGHQPKVVDPAKLAAVEAAYDKVGSGGTMTLAVMTEMYQKGDFETVKTLIEQGKISPQHSIDMADMRIAMMMDSLVAIAKRNNWRIHRSDSGNQSAGMSSDVDQTLYVEEFKDGRWVRSENADARLLAEFRQQFEADHKIPIEHLDIASIAGKDKFPDWRVTSVQLDADGRRAVDLHAAETMASLRKTPGAYTYCGAVVQQMQLRVMDLVEDKLRAGVEADAPPEPRAINAELAGKYPDLRLNQIAFITIGPGEGRDTEVKPREAFQEDAVRVMFDGTPPRLTRGHAYDAAVANYIEFMHHLGDKNPAVKYHLRALDDGLHTLRRLDPDSSVKFAKVEYAKLPESERAKYLGDLFGDSLARHGATGTKLFQDWKMTFDIAAELRTLHSAKQLTDATADAAFRGLAEEIARSKGDDAGHWQAHVVDARAEYAARAQQFLVHNMIATAQTRVAEWVHGDADDPAKRVMFEQILDDPAFRKSFGLDHPRHDIKWANIRTELMGNLSALARLQLLYSFRDLRGRPDVIELIVQEAERKGLQGEDLNRLRGLVVESKSMFFGYREFRKFPKLYLHFYTSQAKAHALQYAGSLMHYVQAEYGLIDTPDGPRPTKLLQSLGMHGMHTRVKAFMAKHRLAGVADRYFGRNFMNIGGVQSAANVMRAYSESGGDPEVARQAFVNEVISSLPLFGQIKGAYEAGTDWKQQILVVGPLIVPQAGLLIAAYMITDAGIAVYCSEYVRPLENTTADAIYRGFVGPTQYEFAVEGNPPAFTEADGLELEAAEQVIAEATTRIGDGEPTQSDARMLAKEGRRAKLLRDKQAVWRAYVVESERHKGGALTGSNAIERQRPVELGRPTDPLFHDDPLGAPGTLLARVEPMVFYSNSKEHGTVDFTVQPLSDAEAGRRDELKRLLEEQRPPHEWVVLEAEWAALDERQQQSERAQRYLDRAKENPELLFQIRRDSLYPYMTKDRSLTRLYATEDFIAKWIAIRNDILPEALAAVGIEGEIRPHDSDVIGQLEQRLSQDIERSRQLWQIHRQLGQHLQAQEEESLERKKGALAAEVLMQAALDGGTPLSAEARAVLAEAGVTDVERAKVRALADAYRMRHVPHAPPRVDITLRQVPLAAADAKPVALEADDFRLQPCVKVTADPSIYVPPYWAVTYLLDPVAASDAATQRNYKGLPLTGAMQDALDEYAIAAAPMLADFNRAEDHFDAVPLTFVFCKDVRIPERVVAETVAQLPRLREYTIPAPDGMSAPEADFGKGYLFGGSASPPPPSKLPKGPLYIELSRNEKKNANELTVTSEALPDLKASKSGIELEFVVLRAQSRTGPFEPAEEGWREICNPSTRPLAEDKTDQTGRISENQMRILDQYLGFEKPDVAHEPYYYRVRQRVVDRSDRKNPKIGKEVLSNIVGPQGARLLLNLQQDEAGQYEVTAPNGRNGVTIACDLIVDNQQFALWDTHFTVTVDGRTTHYFNGRIEDGVHYGTVETRGTKAQVHPWLAVSQGKTTATITAVSGEHRGSATIVITNDNPPDTPKSAALERAESSRASQRQRLEEQLAKDRVQLAKYQEEYAATAEIDDKAVRLHWVREWTSKVRAVEEFSLPDVAAAYDEQVARVNGNWTAVIAIQEQRLALSELLTRIEVSRWTDKNEAADLALTAPNLTDKKKASIHDDKARNLKMAESRRKDGLLRRMVSYQNLMKSAVEAGSYSAYSGYVTKMIEAMAEHDPQAHAPYDEIANNTILLGGDREKAAAYYLKAREIEIAARPEIEKSRAERWAKHRPAWWPRGK